MFSSHGTKSLDLRPALGVDTRAILALHLRLPAVLAGVANDGSRLGDSHCFLELSKTEHGAGIPTFDCVLKFPSIRKVPVIPAPRSSSIALFSLGKSMLGCRDAGGPRRRRGLNTFPLADRGTPAEMKSPFGDEVTVLLDFVKDFWFSDLTSAPLSIL